MFATTCEAASTASKVMSRLAVRLTEKSEDTYTEIKSYIKTKVSFALLESSVLCLRGCRSLKRQPEIVDSAIGAMVEEERLSELNRQMASLTCIYLLDCTLQQAMSNIVILLQ